MSLRNINLKAAYSSTRGDNLLEDFYIPSLSNSYIYKRVAGYFSSNSLAIAARGIANFISINNGSMQLICNIYLSNSDKKVIDNYIDKIQNDFLLDLENMEDELKKDHLKCLGWMLKNQKLDIKIALITDSQGIQHEKIGILEDKEGNIISFSGSENETWMGWLANNEKFHVFCSWNIGEKEHLDSDIDDFNSYWNDNATRASVYKIEDAVKKGLIKIAPKNNSEFMILSERIINELIDKNKEIIRKNPIQQEWAHKKRAIDTFMNHKNGVIEMATGTGKTSVAINIFNQLIDKNKIDGAIISTYGNDLLDQWYSELIEKSKKDVAIYRYYEDYKELNDFTINHSDSILLLNWANLDNLFNYVEVINKKLLIVDEVHGFGSESLRNKLKNKIKNIEYRLGLSATSEREYDQIGNEFIEEEIGPIIFKYNLQDAIKDNILCEFNYIPLHYRLNDEDRQNIQKAYKLYYGKIKQNNNEYDAKIQLYMDLARVRKLSKNKIPVFKDFLKNNSTILKNSIIFVETMEYGKLIQDVIINVNSSFHTYYADDDKENLIKFINGELDLLVTCKRISQGIDIRSIQNIILFSASRGQLETIQRIGRCLRIDPKNPNKVATVLDFIVDKENQTENEDYGDTDIIREKWLLDISKTKRRV